MIQEGKNIYDVVISETGDINNLFSVLLLNSGIDISQNIQSGTIIKTDVVIKTKEVYTIIYIKNPPVSKQVYSGQSIYDLSCQIYGGIDYLFYLLTDNLFNIDTTIKSNQKIIMTLANKGNEKIKKMVLLNSLIFMNGNQPDNYLVLGTESGMAISTEDGNLIGI